MASMNIARAEALAQGLKRFITNDPCRHGHVCERYAVDGKCVACVRRRATVRVKRWAKANPVKKRSHSQKWRDANTEKWRESNRRSKQARQKIYTDRQREDYQRNPEKYRTVERKRRAQMRGSGGAHTAAELKEIFTAQGGRCAYCRIDLKRAKEHVDHILPLALGGSNSRANLQYLCQPCNQSKSARDPIAYAKSIGLLL